MLIVGKEQVCIKDEKIYIYKLKRINQWMDQLVNGTKELKMRKNSETIKQSNKSESQKVHEDLTLTFTN